MELDVLQDARLVDVYICLEVGRIGTPAILAGGIQIDCHAAAKVRCLYGSLEALVGGLVVC